MTRRKSLGCEVPALPMTAQRDLFPEGFQYTVDNDPAWDYDYDWAHQHYFGATETQRRDVGPPGVATWLPETADDLPCIFFAVREIIGDLPWLVRGELI